MILADTSVWVDHFRGAISAVNLTDLLEEDAILIHPWVLGELALGGLGRRQAEVLADLRCLPSLAVVSDDDVLELVQARSLVGTGVGWVDAQLLAATLVAHARLWTHDSHLARVAAECGVAWPKGA